MSDIFFSRGFSMPKVNFPTLSNPLAVANLYRKGGRLYEGEEEGVSFSMKVLGEDKVNVQELRAGSEHYAKVRMVNKKGHIPVVVAFSLNEETFPLLQNKIFKPVVLETGGGHSIVSFEPIQTLAELIKLDEGEVVVQAGNLTSEQLRQLNTEMGTANIGKENERVTFREAITSKAEFHYIKFDGYKTTPEGMKTGLGEGGTDLR